MNERDKLIEILKSVPAEYDGCRGVGRIADHLIANGVIVPPCKEGDTVYAICGDGRIMDCSVDKLQISISVCSHYSMMNFNDKNFSRYFFLTREAAEQALRERENNDQ